MAENNGNAQIGVAGNPVVIEEVVEPVNGQVNEQGTEQVQGNRKRKSSGNTSQVWDHFKKVVKPGTKGKLAYCKYCNQKYSADSKQGTTCLWRHLEKCKRNPTNLDRRQRELSFRNDREINAVINWSFNQADCRNALARMIIVDELPFNFVEHEGFKNFCQIMQPKFQILSRITLRKDCLELYKGEKLKLKGEFEKIGRVSITTDMWTSIQNLGYMCLTAHFIDEDWKLQKKIINFCVVPTPHTGEYIGNSIELCLMSWGLHKIQTITVDNASSNDVAVRSLKRRLAKKNGLLLDGEFLHMRCCAHILNLIVRDGIEEAKHVIARIRHCVRYVRSSPSRLQDFKRCVKEEGISSKKVVCLDVTTRWNSTFFMLESALVFQKAFERMEENDQQYQKEIGEGMPSIKDWVKAKVLCKFLEAFYNVTKRLSGSRYVTSNAYFHEIYAIEGLLSTWSTSNDPSFRDMGLKMKLKFAKYWGDFDRVNILLVIAVILDPCYKLKYVKFCYSKLYPTEKVNEMTAKVMDTLNRLFETYRSSMPTAIKEIVPSQGNMETHPNGVEHLEDVRQEYLKFLKDEQVVTTKSEIDRYLEEGFEVTVPNFSILDWWKANSSRYPIMSHMARDIHAIPVSTVASESAFSTGGRILDRFRSSLTPNIVEALICAQDWLRYSSTPIDIEEKLEELEDDGPEIKE